MYKYRKYLLTFEERLFEMLLNPTNKSTKKASQPIELARGNDRTEDVSTFPNCSPFVTLW